MMGLDLKFKIQQSMQMEKVYILNGGAGIYICYDKRAAILPSLFGKKIDSGYE